MKNNTMRLAFLSLLLASLPAAHADVLYWGGGTTDIANNTALPVNTAAFAGAWNTTTKNWASTSIPGTYTEPMFRDHSSISES